MQARHRYYALGLMSLVGHGVIPSGLSFVPAHYYDAGSSTTRRRSCATTTTLRAAGDDDDTMNEQERMEAVRRIQKSFYAATPPNDDDDDGAAASSHYDEDTGRITNLPLWRVGWAEVPGRANCLNVHEIQYTHLFETVVNGPQPWYVGHLHLPGGFQSSLSGERRFDLKSWREEREDGSRSEDVERSAVVGTLLRVTDFRRHTDGRLCVLVHVLERFVVDRVPAATERDHAAPYSVADVTILPDFETLASRDENFAGPARAAAVRTSFRYHAYEFDDSIGLPLPRSDDYLTDREVEPAEIGKILPFAFYADDDASLDGIATEEDERTDDDEMSDDDTLQFSGGTPSLEQQLLRSRILRHPPPTPGVAPREVRNLDTLEVLVWSALDDFCRNVQFTLPEEILVLLPPHLDWLDMAPPTKRLSPQYPARRRQQRLSYALPALLERSVREDGGNPRQMWLHAPSTRSRLAAVLERFELLNDTLLRRGELP